MEKSLKEKYELKYLKMDQRVNSCNLCCFNASYGCACGEDVDLLRSQVGQCRDKVSYYIKKK